MVASAGYLVDLDKMNALNRTGGLPAVNGRLGLNNQSGGAAAVLVVLTMS
jgi:hypothetical protein